MPKAMQRAAKAQVNHDMVVQHIRLPDDGTFPNSRFPLILYHRAFTCEPGGSCQQVMQEVLETHGWGNGWLGDGIFEFQHYHSVTHEVLGAYCGWARVQFGGPRIGVVKRLEAGDVVLIPAGVAHCRLEASDDFGVLGVYPDGLQPDMMYGHPGERPAADERIARVPLPKLDPVLGDDGPVRQQWSRWAGA